MSSDLQDVAASRPHPGQEVPRGAVRRHTSGTAPSPGPSEQQQQQQSSGPQPQRHDPQAADQRPPRTPIHHGLPLCARHVVRLFQCRQCSAPYRDAVTLPCGRSICKACLPETYARTSITYPALPNRIQAFVCPFEECSREHVLDDCGVDVVLNKAVKILEHEMEPTELSPPRKIVAQDSARAVCDGSLAATWTLATEGDLAFEEADVPTVEPPPPTFGGQEMTSDDTRALDRVREAMRGEMDCQVCYALFHDPLTTGCGHTFCRPCLHRILDHSRHCPVCRRRLAVGPLLKRSSCPSNRSIAGIIGAFWKDDMAARQEATATEHAARHRDLDLPLFICTLSFPTMPTFLHVFEPRYRLMIRRALEGDKTFGMVLPTRPCAGGDSHFHELGTLLRIVNAQFYPDGRSLIETVGLSRFRILRHAQLDGYTVAKTERLDDVSLDEEEAMEAAEVGYDAGVGSADDDGSQPGSPQPCARRPGEHAPQTAADLDAMTTQGLMQFATGFVTRMREHSVPWLTERMLAIYGECPDDPAVFPWWFASTLPVKDLEKYRLLKTSSVRNRLKICASWIMEMETERWSLNGCTIL